MSLKESINTPSFFYFTKTWHSKPYPAISPTRPELSVAGKNIVVTGCGAGIGKAIAMSFAQAGASSITIHGRREGRLKTSLLLASNLYGHEQEASDFVEDSYRRGNRPPSEEIFLPHPNTVMQIRSEWVKKGTPCSEKAGIFQA
jgi:hypothetical protein